jgi:site-specific recombinase
MGLDRGDLSALMAGLNPQASLVDRHLWLLNLVQWLRGADHRPEGMTARLRLLLDAVQARPEWITRWRTWWTGWRAEVDLTPLLADYGFAPRTAFLSEFGHRLRRRLLPGTPDTVDAAELLDLIQPDARDLAWLRGLDTALLARARDLLFPATPGDDTDPATTLLLDAIAFSIGQIAATGFSAEIRVRLSPRARAARSFHALAPRVAALREAVAAMGPHDEVTRAEAARLREALDACRRGAATVYAHLEEHGVSVGIVFRMRQLRERILRVRALLDCLCHAQPHEAWQRLWTQLLQAGIDGRSLRALVAGNTQLTAAKVAERHAESGEHYITRNAGEYRRMLARAAGGGAVIAFTTWIKFALYLLALSPFWLGLVAGLNYAASFVLVMLLHWTVATKQPAVTAPVMAARLKNMEHEGGIEGFTDEVTHLLRSQIAAIAGNLGLVVPVVLLICAGLALAKGPPMLDAGHARHVLHDLRLPGPTALFAAFTGVLLFASSIIAGWVENAFVLHRLDSAVAHNPRFTRLLGPARAHRWARYLRANVSGYAANISLGLMLGLIPVFAAFFGLGLEVRHVTLSAGQLSAAAWTLGLDVFAIPDFWWAVAGIAVIGPLNLGVSFYLAFRLALAARGVSGIDRQRIRQSLWQRWRAAPLSFLLPPRDRTG